MTHNNGVQVQSEAQPTGDDKLILLFAPLNATVEYLLSNRA